MSTTDGARSADDPVLAGAFSEMASEGTFDATAPIDDLGTEGASQASGDASAAPVAAAPPSNGDDGSDPQGSSSADAAPKAPDPSAGSPAADPLAGTEPFTYTVNGEVKTLEGVRRVPGEGYFAPEAHVASLQSLAERADVLDRVSREVTAQNAQFERASTWTFTDAQGNEQTLTGLQGLEAQRIDSARVNAAVSIIDGLLSDPSKLLSLLAQDETGKIVVDPTAVETLQMRVQLAASAAEQQARSHFAKLGAPPNPQQPSTSTGSPSYQASAPKIIEQAAGANHAALSADDRQLLTEQIDRYVRPVTEEDRRWNPTLKIGAPIVDHSFTKVVQHLVAQRQASKQTAAAAEKAGKFNAGQDKGRQPAKVAPKPAAPTAPKTDARKPKADWDSPLSTAMSELGIAR
jgi:hypothetical protein